MRNSVLASGLSTVGTGWQDLAGLWSSSAVVKRVEGAQSSPSGFPQTLASPPNRQGHPSGAAHPQLLPALPASHPWHEPLLCSRELSPAGSWYLPKAGGHFFLYSLRVEQLKCRVPASLGQSLPQLISVCPVPAVSPLWQSRLHVECLSQASLPLLLALAPFPWNLSWVTPFPVKFSWEPPECLSC